MLPVRMLSLLFGLWVGVCGVSQAVQVNVTGANGANGIDGLDSDPATDGTDGQPGESALAEAVSADATNSARAIGGNGGRGGNGGNGIDGSDLGGAANGGDAGSGGLGGAAVGRAVTDLASDTGVSATVFARAGRGGDGGTGGVADFEPLLTGGAIVGTPGADAPAGNGGDASGEATAINRGAGAANVSVKVQGGGGGMIRPFNRGAKVLIPGEPRLGPGNYTQAGDGGSAVLGTVYGASLGGGQVVVGASATGGNGGNVDPNTAPTPNELRAGNGADVSLLNAVDGDTSGILTLTQDADGGNAGNIDGLYGSRSGYGQVGQAGNASSILRKTSSSLSLEVSTRATGGGGSSIRVFFDPVQNAAPEARAGNGGNAIAESVAENIIPAGQSGGVKATATASGGSGGTVFLDAADMGGTAGRGGDAAASASATAVGGAASASATQNGGWGGSVILGNNVRSGRFIAADGTDSVMSDAVSGSSDEVLSLEQIAVGGNGGSVSGPGGQAAGPLSDTSAIAAGNGGNASSTLNASNPGGGALSASIVARGGASGVIGPLTDTSLSYSVPAGGSALVAGNLTGIAGQRVELTAEAVGGVSPGNLSSLGSGGNGGQAELGLLFASGGQVQVNGIARGGSGGSNRNGRGGDGASVMLVDRVDGDLLPGGTFLVLDQRAFGGNGSFGFSGAGLAGSATSILNKTLTGTGNLTVNTRATGGLSGSALAMPAVGGDAVAESFATKDGDGDVVSSARADGGWGMDASGILSGQEVLTTSAGAAGSARAVSDTTLTNDLAAKGGSDALATGGRGGRVSRVATQGRGIPGGRGGDANAVAVTRSLQGSGSASLTAGSRAMGGDGGNIDLAGSIAKAGDGGNAFARARLITAAGKPVGTLSVQANAVGGRGGANAGTGPDGRGGNATAIAEANTTASFVSATANATPGAGAGGANSLAVARITGGGGGRSTAGIETRWANGLTQGLNVQAANTAVGQAPATGSVEAIAGIGSVPADGVSTSAAGGDHFSIARVAVAPDTSVIRSLLTGNRGVADNFDLTGGSDVLALASLGAFQDGSRSSLFSNDFSMALDMSLLDTQQDLLFGFMNPTVRGNGFDALSMSLRIEGRLVFSQSFTDVTEARGFLDDQTLDFGDWTQGLIGPLDIAFSVDYRINGAGDAFYFDTIFGNSTIGAGVVPVPPAVWLFLSGFLSLAGIARCNRATQASPPA
ncbi:MAG TPA: hypothetical protein ENK49_00775 [Gammaproteobacteria bacterium]|nr:hypothetical protein [Gammaproteobacteria bacterium]